MIKCIDFYFDAVVSILVEKGVISLEEQYCLLNDKAVLNTPKAAELFRSKGVAVFYADWTERLCDAL